MARRFIALFLSLYVIILTLSPCVDQEEVCCDFRHEQVMANNVSGHQEREDCCSPFCTCSCCSLPCEVVNPYVVPSTYYPLQTINYFFEPQLHSIYLFSIWEPPKA